MARKKTAESPAKPTRARKTVDPTPPPTAASAEPIRRPTRKTGAVKGADLRPVRRRTKSAAPVISPLTYDVTRHDALIAITSPNTGRKTRYFRVETQPVDAAFCPGRRIAYLWRTAVNATGTEVATSGGWYGFAFVDEFGVHCWGRLKSSSDEPSQWEKYCGMLEQPSLFIGKGCTYKIDPIA
jgi:hypothetical protein